MRSQWKRLLVAALLSCASFAATLLWYHATDRQSSASNEAPLAQVSSVGEEVLRRPATRLLWQAVNTGDNLYHGETIRTSARGELRIQFEDGRYIDLEPDSLIVLAKSKGEISLDLMEGSLFVNAKAQEGDAARTSPGLVLNSKSGKVDLSGASASLSKGSGDNLDLQVLEGKARIQGKDGEKEIGSGKMSSLTANGLQFENSNLVLISPRPLRPTYVDPSEEKPVVFRWKGFPPEWKVAVHAGPSRRELKEVASTPTPGETQIATKLPLGKFNWKLVAINPADGKIMAESPLQRSELLPRYAPTTLFPLPDQDLPLEKTSADVTFRWQRPEPGVRFQLEVSRDPGMTNPIANQAFTEQEQFTVPNLTQGEYHWRMNAYYEGNSKPVVGKVLRFRLLPLGSIEPARIAWTIPEEKKTQVYSTEPQLELSWQPQSRASEIVSYRLRLQDEADLSGAAIRHESKELATKAKVPRPGRYVASIEAVDKSGNVVGKSDPQTFVAQELPRISGPTLPGEGPLRTGADGKLELRWDAVEGAKGYQITVIDKDGKELAKKQYGESKASLRNLMPGEYSVKLEAIDNLGRTSQDADTRPLVVPEKSHLKAPTLKRIKVN